MEFLRTN